MKATSRLVLYFLTNAQNEAERNTAGKYARVVDYLHKERVDNVAAADHVRSLGGMNAILKKARGCQALKGADDTLQDDAADETQQDDVEDFDRGEDPDETDTGTSVSGQNMDELFDPEEDLSIRVGSETRAQVLAQLPQFRGSA